MKMRCFLAIPLSEATVEYLQHATIAIRANNRDARIKWVAPHNLHLTLAFLGDVDISLVSPLETSLRAELQGLSAFPLQSGGVISFPSRKPRIVALALEASKELINLKARVDRALRALELPVDERSFEPHVTLGRIKDNKRVALTSDAGLNCPGSPAERIVIFKSELTRQGPIYSVLGEALLEAVSAF